MLFQNEMVSLQHHKSMPSWGLFNGSVGKVQNIVYEKGKNPNDGHLLKYTVVRFESYCVPVWNNSDPKVHTSKYQIFRFKNASFVITLYS